MTQHTASKHLPMQNGVQDGLDVDVGGYTTAGKKLRNEDAFAAKIPASVSTVKYKGVVACLADGVSCSENAHLASHLGVAQFIEDYYSTPDSWSVKHSAARVLNSLNSWLYHHGQLSYARHNGLVMTFSSLVLKSTTAHLFHVGDSRIYQWRKGKLTQLTRDHVHKQQAGKSFLTRALGMDSHLEVDYHQEPLQLGDILILTSDGLHEFVQIEKEAKRLLTDATGTLEEVAKELVDLALSKGSNDNISCLLLRIKALPKADVEEVHRQLTDLTIPPVMEVGHAIDQFKILRVIYSGTRSHLYLVKDKLTAREYVLKAPSENFSEDPQYLEGFVREQWVGRRLSSPWVMKIYERPHSSAFLYHLCEYVDGITLRQWMYDNPRPTLATVRELTENIVRGVRVFQRMGMVHRDLKPENIIVKEDKSIVIIDFGTVQVDGLEEIINPLHDDTPVGAVNYFAPEYLRGEKGAHISDIFSVGVMVYEMLTGELPYKAQSSAAPSVKTWHYRPARNIRSDIPLWLDLCLEKVCAESAARRYRALSEFLLDLSTPNNVLVSENKNSPWIKRKPLLVWQCVSLVLFVLLLIQSWWLTQSI